MSVTIFERKKGSGVYYLRVCHKGKKVVKKVGTYAQAVSAKRIVVGEIEGQGDDFSVDGKKNVPTLSAMVDEYLTNRTNNLKKSSLAAYRGAYREHLEKSNIAAMPVDKIEQRHIVSHLNRIASVVSRSTVERVRILMRKGFSLAKLKKHIFENPAMDIEEDFLNIKKRERRLDKNKVLHS